MSRRTVGYATWVRCDTPGCASEFLTFSLARLARIQARLAGWMRSRRRLLDCEGNPVDFRGSRHDLCPDHVESSKKRSK